MRPLTVALWEVRTYIQDKADLAFSLLLPIAIFALMYGAFGSQSLFHGTAHVVNQDENGRYSELLVERLHQLKNLDVELISLADANRKLKRSDLLMVVVIPKEFSSRLASRNPARLVFKQRGNGGQEGQITASLVRGAAEEINQELQTELKVKGAVAGLDISEADVESVVERFVKREREHPIIGVRDKTVGSRPDPVNQFLPGIVTMFVLFAITLSARALVEERKKGTLERLLTTRLSVSELFIGKFLANALRGFFQTFILLALSYAVLQLFTPVSFLLVLVVGLVFSAAVSALGLVISSAVRTEDQATWVAVFFTMVMVMLGGTFFDIPKNSVLYGASKVSLNTYANEAFKTVIAKGGSLAAVGPELAVLGGVVVFGLVVSRILFRVVPGGR